MRIEKILQPETITYIVNRLFFLSVKATQLAFKQNLFVIEFLEEQSMNSAFLTLVRLLLQQITFS